jgi:ATP-binding cassette subfamily F protein 3
MFSGDDVFKPLGVLSGGERNRYAMAKMLVSPANMLLLDEPTNHLDLRAKDVLLEAIANFTGTVLFVSHDRYFIDGLATRVFEVEDHRVHIYPGNYEDYLWRKQGGPEKVSVSLSESLKPHVPEPAPPEPEPVHEAVHAATHARRVNPIKLKQIEDRLTAVEQKLTEIDIRIDTAEQSLGHYVSSEVSQQTAASLDDLRQQRIVLTTEWESLASTLEEQSSPSSA